MTPILAGLLGLVVGVSVAVIVLAIIRRRPDPEADVTFDVVEPVLPAGLSEAIAVMPSAVAVCGPHDEVLQSTLLARSLGIVRGSRVAIEGLLTLVRESRRDRTVLTTELRLDRGGINVLHLAARVAPLRDGLVMLMCEDKSSERRVEETRRDFVINVSHELKTPIGAISLLAEAVEAAADEPDAVRRFSSRMRTESERLTVLVGQIIQLSRLQADRPLTQAEPVFIDEVLAGALDRCQVDAERRGVTLTVAGEKGCEVRGDAAQLETAVGNLIENAVVYSDPGARVVAAAHLVHEPEDDWVEITVSDNGIGIAPADLDRIFERFYRVDYARSRDNGGTGLGLAIVKHVAAVHGGSVDVWSQQGHGSTFSIRIPVHQLHDATGDDHPREDHDQVDHEGLGNVADQQAQEV